MTVANIIAQVNQLKPNAYSQDFLVQWINEVEGMIFNELVKNSRQGQGSEFTPIDYIENPDRQLYAPDTFGQLYVYYLMAKIDFADCETSRYNNDITMFNSEYQNFSAWYNRNNSPKNQTGIIF